MKKDAFNKQPTKPTPNVEKVAFPCLVFWRLRNYLFGLTGNLTGKKLWRLPGWGSPGGLGPPGGWCSSGAVKFEKSSAFIKSATNLRKKRSKIDKTFSSNGPNFFFEGAKLFFSWALFSFHDGLKNEYPAGTPQRTETKIASFPLSKIDKTFFFYGPNFFFWWPNFFSLGVFFSLFGGVFHFFI